MSIKGHCITYRHGYENATWPSSFVAVPRVGELIEAKSGACLRVGKIRHKVEQIDSESEGGLHSSAMSPYIEIELVGISY